MRSIIVMILSVACLLTSCEPRPVAHDYCSTPIEGWEPGDTLKFSIDTLRESGTYILTLGLRASASTPCPYRSVWLAVRQHWHNPEQQRIDTIELKLTDSKGDVIGHGVSLYQYTLSLDSLQLKAGSSAKFSINHVMRSEMLPGIAAVGVKLVRM